MGTAYNTGGGNQGIAAGLGKQVAFANPLANPPVGRAGHGRRHCPDPADAASDPFAAFGADKNYRTPSSPATTWPAHPEGHLPTSITFLTG
ncbi:MAG: hypothetical protein U0R64_06100 [Candidatus Nanopelagicales bacterium]